MPPASYDRVASSLHWLIGVGLLAQIAFGFLLDDIAPRGTPARSGVINLHKSMGIVLGLLVVLRLVWRLRHAPPGWPRTMPPWQQRAARLGHRVLYACMLVMPLSGYLASNVGKRGVVLFGWPLAPWGPELPALYSALQALHAATAWLFCALVAGHVAAALKHALIDRDGIFGRITPWAAGAAGSSHD
ncbi:cytochrome b [Piscinibacter koreensis]|uniref:Cytochrome b n=1 Tax=Piscinibacter koreensis TaxID=2742824 RepID=A0A7Y6TWR6_9BURK|nr:cytochrome b [Schlegelella koreensis]NUZ06409.1 cytochrome b [Schlegelella koreensis]